MYCDVTIPVAGLGVMIGDMWYERPLWLELVVCLLDGKARPVRWNLMSNTPTKLCALPALHTIELHFFIHIEPDIVSAKAVRLEIHPVKKGLGKLQFASEILLES